MYQNKWNVMTILYLVVMAGGLLFGILAWLFLPDTSTILLRQYIDEQLISFDQKTTIKESIGLIAQTNATDLVRIFLCGMCVIGVPLVLCFIFIKCFSIGFVTFALIQHSILLFVSRMLYLPILFISMLFACRFGIQLVQGRFNNPLGQLLQYTIIFVGISFLMLFVSTLDGLSNYYYLVGQR